MFDRFAIAFVFGFLAFTQGHRPMGPPPAPLPTILTIKVDADADDFIALAEGMTGRSPDVYRAVGIAYLLIDAMWAAKLPKLTGAADPKLGGYTASFGDYYQVWAETPEGAVGHLVIEHGYVYGIVPGATRAASQRLRLVYPQGSPLNAVSPTAANLPVIPPLGDE